jgi:hypothetical protein
MAVFMPVPPRGVIRCAASPTRNVLRCRKTVGELRGEGERPDPLDPRLQVRDAGAEPDAGRGPVLGVVLRRLLLGPVLDAVHPAVTATGRDEDSRGAGVGDGVDAVAAVAEQVPQGGAELRAHGRREPVSAHGNAQDRTHRAAATVGPNQVARADDPRLAVAHLAQHHLDTVGAAVE